MEDDRKAAAMDGGCAGKLNFNAPLLSTRHPGGFPLVGIPRSYSQGTSRDTSTRVPFSWEQAPGKPKDTRRFEPDEDEDLPPPPPGLPPGRWNPPKEDSEEENYQHYDDNDDGFDADVDLFSDAIDMFSLSDALDHIVEAAEKVHGLDGLKLGALESRGRSSPNFIIQRFLPAAQALAASSALNSSRNLNRRVPHSSSHPEDCLTQQGGRSCSSSSSSPRGCGLEFFFPWRMKHKLCGVKSPVRHCPTPSMKPESGGKHKRNYSLVERPVRDYGV